MRCARPCRPAGSSSSPGLVGSGKTHLLSRIEGELTRAGRVAVCRSLVVEKARVTLSTLIEALFYDLGDKNVVIPKPPEKRERELRELVRKARRPVVLIVDEAQDLHAKTLIGLKRLMEVVAGGGGLLSMLLGRDGSPNQHLGQAFSILRVSQS